MRGQPAMRAPILWLVATFVSTLVIFGRPPSVTLAVNGFSPNQELKLPTLAPSDEFCKTQVCPPVRFIVRGLEPSVRVAQDGAVYVASIRGVPGGVDLHRYYRPVDGAPNADGSYPFKYEGQPDGCGILADGCANLGVAEGGGDVDIAVNYPQSGVPNLALSSLLLVPGVTTNHSTNRGDSFTQPNPLGALIPGDDRQWMDATGTSTVYLAYHDIGTFQIEVQRSNDRGQTYLNGVGQAIDPQTFPAAGGVPATNTANVAGSIRVDRSACPSRGNLYQIFVAPDSADENAHGKSARSVYVGVSTDVKLGLSVFTFTDYKVFTGPEDANFIQIFPALAVDRFSNLYAVWSDNSKIFYTFSTDLGIHWATPIALNTGVTAGKTNVFPWIDADANGHVGVAWFGGDRAGNSNDKTIHEPGNDMTKWTNWNVYYAESLNGHAASPTFVQSVISDHVIHRGTVSTGGLGGNANRNLGDYFQIAFDPQHRANVAFSDDHKVNTEVGPDNGADNPTTRRLIRANFTRQLRAPEVRTEGVCAGTGIRPPEDDEDQGDENDDEDDMSFVDRHDRSDGSDNGALLYRDHKSALAIRSDGGVGSIAYSGRCVSFVGNARVNGQLGYQLKFTGCDVAEPGAGLDTYVLDVVGPAGFSFHKAKTITSGNIRLHQP